MCSWTPKETKSQQSRNRASALRGFRATNFASAAPYFGKGYKVEQIWFDQQEYNKRGRPGWGSPTGYVEPAYWRGVGYYRLTRGDTEIKFSVPYEKQYIDETTRAVVYGHPELDFVIFARGSDRYSTRYFIKPK